MHFSEDWSQIKPSVQVLQRRSPQPAARLYLLYTSHGVDFVPGREFKRGGILYKMNEADGIFVNERFATSSEEAEDGLRFPIDEWACCMQTPVITKPWPFPAQFTQEWMADDVYTAFSQLWSNVSRFSHINHFEHVPFTLDIAGGSHKVKWSLVQRITGSKGNEAALFISCFKGDEFVMNHDESQSFGAAFGFAKSFMAHGRIHHSTHIYIYGLSSICPDC